METNGTAWSPRDVLKHFPDFNHSEVDTFLNGQGDALQGDSFRYDRIFQKYNPIKRQRLALLDKRRYVLFEGGRSGIPTTEKEGK